MSNNNSMYMETSNYQRDNSTYLQGVARWVTGTPAGDLEVGSTIIFNGGSRSKVIAIVKETAKTITVRTRCASNESNDRQDYEGERRFMKARIVARPYDELPGKAEEKKAEAPTETPEQKIARKMEKSLSHDLGMTVTGYAYYPGGFAFIVPTELEAYKAVYRYRHAESTEVSEAPEVGKWCVMIKQDSM